MGKKSKKNTKTAPTAPIKSSSGAQPELNKKMDPNKPEDNYQYRTVELERLNTIVILPNDTKTVSYFPYNPQTGVFSTEGFRQANFSNVDLVQLKNKLEKIADVIVESRIFEVKNIDTVAILIGMFVCCAIYNNVFTMKTKDFPFIEILPTIVLGFIVCTLMIARGIKYFGKDRSMFKKANNFPDVLKKIEEMLENLNKEEFAKKGLKISVNKNCGYIRLGQANPETSK